MLPLPDDSKPDIPGADTVVTKLGHRPSFHDAEIIRFHLERDGVSTISILLVGLDKPRIVTFTMEHISALSLDGENINAQNVIMGVDVARIAEGVRLTFAPCYGLAGHLTADRVSVQLDSDQ